MRRRRSRLLIIHDILGHLLANGGEDYATRIATATGLAYDRLSSLLEDLVDKGIVEVYEEDSRRLVKITRRGVELYEHISRLAGVIRDFGLDI
ncbi:MAG: MarR family transcriptional regulator [Desulfurococcales archaeon]|nr:MarR family transcriptional regulator [Desulfurococcales archaeon]